MSAPADTGPHLRSTGFVERPHLTQHRSAQSVTAEEYQQSIPSRSSPERRPESSSSNEAPPSPDRRRWSTPPQSPSHSPVRISEDAAGHAVPQHDLVRAHTAPDESAAVRPRSRASIMNRTGSANRGSVRFDESSIRRKPVTASPQPSSAESGAPPRVSQMGYDTSPPTPGIDDSPYILFAIDQLTRDEEVTRHSRNYPTTHAPLLANPVVSGPNTPLAAHPIIPSGPATPATPQDQRRIHPAEALVTPARAYTRPETRPSREDDDAEEEQLLAAAPDPVGYQRPTSRAFSERNLQPPIPAPINTSASNMRPLSAMARIDAPTPITEENSSVGTGVAGERSPAFPAVVETPATTTEPPPATVSLAPESDPLTPSTMQRIQRDVFVPFDEGGSPLRFLPSIVRPRWLALYLFLLLWVLAALLVSGIWSGTHLGFETYAGFGGGKYFVYQYLPTLLGTALLLWLFQIQIATQRMAPFMAMASPYAKSRTEGPLLEYMPTQFLLPRLQWFRAGQPLIGACMLIFWLQIWTLPLLTVLYNVYFYGDQATGQWRWNANQSINWLLFAIYLLQAVAIVLLMNRFHRHQTGLKWDPRSLADLIALLDSSNIMNDYKGSEAFPDARAFRQRLSTRSDRLGYWHTSKRPNDTFYGIGEEGGATRRYTLEQGTIREKGPAERSSFPDTPATADMQFAFDLEATSNEVRYRYLPWYIRPLWLLFWTVAAFVLYLAFLIVSYINDAVLDGFAPLTPITPSASGYSATNFTYSFVPAILATLLFLSWLSVDYAFRRLEPYAQMASSADGAPADSSLLLDYPFAMPFTIIYTAVLRRHFRIAWYSLLTLITATLPTLAGGTFWAQFYVNSQQVRVAVEPSGYYAMNVFLAFLVFSLPWAFRHLRRRCLPHRATSLADQISWLYQSRVLGEREWRAPMGAKDDVRTRLRAAVTPRERDETLGQGRFIFGRFEGRDGTMHLGIERLGRGRAGDADGGAIVQRHGHQPPFTSSSQPQMTTTTSAPRPPRDSGVGSVDRPRSEAYGLQPIDTTGMSDDGEYDLVAGNNHHSGSSGSAYSEQQPYYSSNNLTAAEQEYYRQNNVSLEDAYYDAPQRPLPAARPTGNGGGSGNGRYLRTPQTGTPFNERGDVLAPVAYQPPQSHAQSQSYGQQMGRESPGVGSSSMR